MKGCTVANLSVVVFAGTLSAATARAQDATAAPAPDAATSHAVSVTPFVSVDSRGSSPIGAVVSFPLGSGFSVDSEVGYRRGEGGLNALSSSANVVYSLPRLGRAVPYVAAGAGISQYGTPIVSRGGGSVIGTQPRIAFEVNAGAGLKVPVDDSWGMRTDARWFKSFGRQASEHWRVSQGVSFDVGKR